MIPTIQSYGINHYDISFEASEISYNFGSDLYGLSAAVHEAFDVIEQVCDLTFIPRAPQNDEPRIEFGDAPQPGAFGDAVLYVTDELDAITGGLINTAGPDQTIMNYGIFSQARGWLEAADIALLQDKYGPSDDDNIIWGGPGTGEIFGGAGTDTIYGNEGVDVLLGNTDADWLHGGQGDDYVHGGQGDDTIWGGAGADILNGGDGADVIYYDAFDTVISDQFDTLIYIGG